MSERKAWKELGFRSAKEATAFGIRFAEEAVAHYDFVMSDYQPLNAYHNLTKEEYQLLMRLLEKGRSGWAVFAKHKDDVVSMED